MIYCFSVLLLLLGSFVVQEFVPVFSWASDSRLLLVHALFYSAAVSVPFPVMLILAFITGFVWDCRYYMSMPAVETGQLELPFGFTILLFGLLGAFIQGVRPFFRQGRWELPVLMIGGCTLVGMLFENLVISFQRGNFEMTSYLWWKLLFSSLYSMLLAPFLLLLLSRLAAFTGFKIQMDGITRRYSYDADSL